MNDYTIRVCDILESLCVPIILKENPLAVMGVDEIIEKGMDYFFSFDFPWYTNKNDKSLYDFKNLFLHLNYLESIGQENFSQFQLVLQSKLMEVMPTYTELYKTLLMEYDPRINRTHKLKREETGNGNASSSGTSKSTGKSTENLNTDSQNVHSENPEISVTDNNFASSMDRGKQKNVNDISTNADGTTSSTSKTDYGNNIDETYEGFEGESVTDSIVKYRNAILNLNKQLCDELHKVCFLHYYGVVFK